MRIFFADDSTTALKITAQLLKAQFQDASLSSFSSGKELIETIEHVQSNELPDFILSDLSMPDVNGIELIKYLKRHTRLHNIPVILVTAESAETQKLEAKKFGAFDYVLKPLTGEKLQNVFTKVTSTRLSHPELIELDRAFVEETLEHTEEISRAIQNLNQESAKLIYRFLHTIKGGANSLQFFHIGRFIHTAENFLNAVIQGKLYSLPQVISLFHSVVGYLESQMEQIKKEQLLDLPPQELIDGLNLVKANVDAGWKLATDDTSEQKSKSNDIVAKAQSSVRIANEKLDELQKKFRKILQLRTQLNRFAMQLKQEFSDEGFPNDLMKLVEELGGVSADLMDFFISLRVVPVNRLKNFATRTIDQAKEQLGKAVHLEFESEPFLEIDQKAIEALETALTHILRNSVDHGIEATAERVKTQKNPVGTIYISIKKENAETVSCTVKDDGAGLDREKLKKLIIEKNILPADKILTLSPENIDELIFVDGLTTKTEVSDISGRGVGLSAVQEQITSLGGIIKVSSSPGMGTQFQISIPRIFQL